MKPAYQKITGLGFLLLGLLPLLFVIFFLVQQKVIRHQMREKLELDNLQQLVINEKDVIWMDDHEIWVNDHMFDIHSKELKDGIYTFTGLYDERETRLMEQHEKTNENSPEGTLLAGFFKHLPVICNDTGLSYFQINVPNPPYYLPPVVIRADPFTSIPTPPPDFDYRT